MKSVFKRRARQKPCTYYALVPFLNTISKHLTFHISKPTNTTVWFWKCFKCYKYHFFVVFFGKRYTKSFIECQVTKALPQFTTPMFDCLTMDIYFQTIFFMSWKTKMNIKKKKVFRKLSCMCQKQTRPSTYSISVSPVQSNPRRAA